MSEAPVAARGLAPGADTGEMPRARLTRRRAVLLGVCVAGLAALLYFGLPRLAGLEETLQRVREGDLRWLLVCLLLELCAYASFVALFRAVYVRGSRRIGWRASYEITLAGLAATRLFAAAGAGGAALTAWALNRSGMRPRVVAERMVAQYALLYGVYMLSLIAWGTGMYLGVVAGSEQFALTMVPAIFGALVIAVALGAAFIPTQVDRTLARWSEGGGRGAHMVAQASKAPAAISEGMREAIRMIRRREPGTIGALTWWYFDILVLWAAFHAFGEPGSLAVVAVLAYRLFAFWLPTIPGAIAYVQLRRTVAGWRAEQREEVAMAIERLEELSAGARVGTIQSEVSRPATGTRSLEP
jgi:uncharacterized membrane protein YbhN (UPF0104 family)